MSNMMAMNKLNFDSFGQKHLRLAALLMGLWMGVVVDHYRPDFAFLLSKLAMLTAIALFWLAYYRSKPVRASDLDLRP
jgi:hypothetical protein